MRRFALLASICLVGTACSSKPQYPYQNPKFSVDRRAEDLLHRMTAPEKSALLRTGAADERLGIPALRLPTNGPRSGLALAATWDPDLVGKVASHTNTAFGYYGEDPWLASRMTVAWTSAVQAEDRIGTLLNFPCGSEADERTLNEIYYPPFRSAIEEAGLWSVTSACPEDGDEPLWGFRGFVAGRQSGGDDQVRLVLRAIIAAGYFDDPPMAPKDAAETKKILRTAGEEGVVLLKNDGGLLPLYSTKLKSIGVVGSAEQLAAIKARAGATPVIAGEGADVVITFGSPTIIKDWTRQAVLEDWGDAVAATDVIFGDVDPSGKLPITLPKTPVNSRDGIFAGYRYFDEHKIEPLYPFGFGLSYTTFEWRNLRVFPASPRYGQTVQVVVNVTNIGSRAGAETVEVYLHQEKPSLDRPPDELKGFARVDLKPGEAQEVAVTLDHRSMSLYDPVQRDWAAEPGVFDVLVGTSSRDIRLRGSFQLFR